MRLSRVLIGSCALAAVLAVEVPPASAVGSPGDLYVSGGSTVRVYDGVSGNELGVFATSVNGNGQAAIHFGATNNRVLVGHYSGGVEEFDATTGVYIKTYSPGGVDQWAGIYAPDGNVYVGSYATNDIRKYDSTTGAYLATMCPIPGPADMEYGPNGNLYVCSLTTGMVYELDPNSLATVSSWSVSLSFVPPGSMYVTDIAFLPTGRILVTAAGINRVFAFDASHTLITHFNASGLPLGMVVSPHSGDFLVTDSLSPFPPEGMYPQVNQFHPGTYALASPGGFLSPTPTVELIDIAFRPAGVVPAAPSTWGRIKGRYR